jgi:hypothetical protein
MLKAPASRLGLFAAINERGCRDWRPLAKAIARLSCSKGRRAERALHLLAALKPDTRQLVLAVVIAALFNRHDRSARLELDRIAFLELIFVRYLILQTLVGTTCVRAPSLRVNSALFGYVRAFYYQSTVAAPTRRSDPAHGRPLWGGVSFTNRHDCQRAARKLVPLPIEDSFPNYPPPHPFNLWARKKWNIAASTTPWFRALNLILGYGRFPSTQIPSNQVRPKRARRL